MSVHRSAPCRLLALIVMLLLPAACEQTTQAPTGPTESTVSTPPTGPTGTTALPPTPESEVPDAQGLTAEKASKVLARAELQVSQETEYSHDPAGSVIDQDPSAGSVVPEGTTVSMVIAEPFPVIPDVVGLTVAQAKKALKQAGFNDARVKQSGTSGTPGTVTSQTPAAGSEALPGRTITLVIPDCTAGYSPCLPPASDYDCIGGTGDGPKYTGRVTVTGSDPYGLDADNDGIGCE